jgi:alpha-L-fucosidase 2
MQTAVSFGSWSDLPGALVVWTTIWHHEAQSVPFRDLLMCVAALALSAPAVAQPCPAFRVGSPDGNYIVPGVKGNIRYAGDLALDAYVHQGPARRPSVVIVHGGGWSSGSRIAHVGQILEVLTRAGYNWFSVDYRLGGVARYEDSLADIRTALAFIRCRAADFRIDPNRLVLLGEDSGAQLAALLATERPRGVIGAILLGGFYDLAAIPDVTGGMDREALARASPMSRVSAPMPPLLVVHGGADTESPAAQARRYCSEVSSAGGRCELIEVAGASHRSENWWPNQWHYKRPLVEWIARVTGAATTSHRPPTGVLQKDIVYSPSSKLALDAFIPAAAAPTAAVIVVHGGGWEAGDKVTYVTPMFEPLARAGIAWFSIDYRLTPAFTHENQLEDLRQAIRFVRSEHQRFNIDPSRIVLLGESASGQMVALLAADDRALAGVVSFYGVYDFTAMVTDASPRSLLVRLFRRAELNDEARAELRRYSPLHRAHKDMPPLLLVNGTGERLWAQAQTFAQRLTELGVRHEVIALDGAPHGMENWEGHPEWLGYKQRVVEWIQTITSTQR